MSRRRRCGTHNRAEGTKGPNREANTATTRGFLPFPLFPAEGREGAARFGAASGSEGGGEGLCFETGHFYTFLGPAKGFLPFPVAALQRASTSKRGSRAGLDLGPPADLLP